MKAYPAMMNARETATTTVTFCAATITGQASQTASGGGEPDPMAGAVSPRWFAQVLLAQEPVEESAHTRRTTSRAPGAPR